MREENPEILDISPVVSEQMAVFPGDTPYRRRLLLDCQNKSDHLTLSTIETTVHLGAHTDGPNHYHPEGKGIDSRDLGRYYGPCQVVSVEISPGERIFPKDIALESIERPRVLFRTGSYPDPNQWHSEFNSLSPELIYELAKKDVCLVGIDTPSIDPAQSEELESHHAVFEKDLSILEGIILNEVPDGFYTLIALPLRLKDADASPVRAVLLRERTT